VAALLLALGIGSTTAIITAVHGVLSAAACLVGRLSCVAAARRALRIEASEDLRSDRGDRPIPEGR
jgi:hypothetical protein